MRTCFCSSTATFLESGYSALKTFNMSQVIPNSLWPWLHSDLLRNVFCHSETTIVNTILLLKGRPYFTVVIESVLSFWLRETGLRSSFPFKMPKNTVRIFCLLLLQLLTGRTNEIQQQRRHLFHFWFLLFLSHLKARLCMSLIGVNHFVSFQIENAGT